MSLRDFSDGFRRNRRLLTQRLGLALTRLGLAVERTSRSQSLDALLVRRLTAVRRARGEFFFLQIGANDGISHDPIHAFVTANRLAGIVVEPLPDVFARLDHTYRRHPQIRKVNAAIHNTEERLTLYRPDPRLGGDSSGIASFDRHRHELTRERSGIRSEDIVAVEVPAIALPALLERERVTHLDLLQIDTEGYDMDILESLDLERHRPSIIRFEHGIYSGAPVRDKLRAALLRLYDHGYSIAMERVDAMAWRHEDIAKPRRGRAADHEPRVPAR